MSRLPALPPLPRLLRWLLIAAVLGLLLVLVLRPTPRLVDAVGVATGDVVDTVESEGRTRVRDRYLIAAPIAASARRLQFEPGDAVAAGQVLVVLDPPAVQALDARSRREAERRLEAAQARWRAAGEELRAAEALATQAAADAERLSTLAGRGLLPIEQAEQARTAAQRAERDAASARFRRATAAADRDAAAAALHVDDGDVPGIVLSAPVDGVLLRRHFESAQPVQAGMPLVEIGDPAALEVEVDVLSADAVRLAPGMRVQLLRWGGAYPLDARVRRIEPGGFTKISALGVEEQRVWVIVDIDSPREQWTALGDGFRVDARFELARADGVVRVPSSALFRHRDGWALFRIVDGRARLSAVEPGLRGGLWTQIVRGVDVGDVIIAHPERELADGERVRARS